MFDDHTSQGAAGAPPPNLPVGEPEDIFASTEAPLGDIPAPAAAPSPVAAQAPTPPRSAPAPAPVAPASPPSQPPQAGAPSALSAGVLKPKTPAPPPPLGAPPAASPPKVPGQAPTPSAPAKQTYKVQGPSFLRTAMMIVICIIIIGAVIGGGYWVYAAFIKDDAPATPPVTQQPAPADTNNLTPEPSDDLSSDSSDDDADQLADDPITVDDQILFGELVDSDNDGLDDEQERSIGTDPQNWDTDNDELSDYDEVAIWKTDPFSIDTDGDTFLDGEEVNNGYNPAGQGRIFEPPAPSLDGIIPPPSSPNDTTSGGRPTPSAGAAPPLVPQPTVISGDGKSCDADGDCFLASAAVCEKATHSRVTLLDLWDVLGVRQYVTHYMQILGYNEAGLCEWYLRIDDVDITFKDDISPEIQAENRQALETTIGWDGSCRMETAELAALIQKWNDGGFSSDDLQAPKCQGRIFDS